MIAQSRVTEGTHSWRAGPPVRVRCLLAMALLLGWIGGCGSSSGARPAPAEETLRIGARGNAEAPRVIAESLFAEPLVALDWSGRPSERLATAWEWQDEGSALHLQLRPGIRFHDGTPVTAQTVAAILRKQLAAGPRGFEALSQIDTPDERSVVLRLTRPDAFLISAVSGTLIVDDSKPDIGTGPFRIVTRTPLEAVKNVAYYRGTPAIDRIRMVPYETPRAAWAGLMRGEVDMAHEVSRDSLEFLQKATRVALYSSLQPFYIPLVFNVTHPILGRVEVRRALVEALDREEIIAAAMRGHGRVADDPVWPSHWAYNPAARRHTYNPAAARVRLDAAGLPVRPAPPGSGRRSSRFRIACLVYNEDPQFERIALLLERQLAAVGVDLQLESVTQKVLTERAASGDFDTYLFQLSSGRSFDRTYSFWHSPGRGPAWNQSGYRGADEVLDRLRRARNDTDIRIAVGDLRERFYEDVPAAFIAWLQTTRAIDARFDVGDRSDPEVFANLWRWRPQSNQQAAR